MQIFFSRQIRFVLAVVLISSFSCPLLSPMPSFAGGGGGPTPKTCTFTGAVSTAWEVVGNWSCAQVPISIDTVIIPAAQTVVVASGARVASALTIAETGNLTISDGTLSMTTLTNNGTFTVTGGIVSVGAELLNNGVVAINGGSTTAASMTNGAVGSVTGSGAVSLLSISGSLTNVDTITHTGGWTLSIGPMGFSNSGTYTAVADASVMRFNATTPPSALAYPNLELEGAVSLTDGATYTAQGNVTLLDGSTITSNSSTIALAGNWYTSSTATFTSYTGTVRFTGSATSTITVENAAANFYRIEINKDAADAGAMLLSHATATQLIQTQGLFDTNGFVLGLPTSCFFTGAATTNWATGENWDCGGVGRLPMEIDFVRIPVGQTVNIEGGILAMSNSIGSLTIELGATLTTAGTLTVNGTSTNAGSILMSGGQITLNGGMRATSTNMGSLFGTSGYLVAGVPVVNEGTMGFFEGGTLRLQRNMTNIGTLNVSGAGTLSMAAGSTIVPDVGTVGTLEIGTNNSLSNNLAVTGGVMMTGGRLDLAGYTLSLSGNAGISSTSNGSDFNSTLSGTLRFTGAGTQTIDASTWTYPGNAFVIPATLEIDKTGGSVSQGSSVVTTAGLVSVLDGTYNVDVGQLVVLADMTIASGAVLTSALGSTIAVEGGVSCSNAGVLSIGGTGNVYGTLNNSGEFIITSDANVTVDGTLANSGTITGNSFGGTLTLNNVSDSFTATPGSTFVAPLAVTFNGPTVMPAYSYNNIILTSSAALSTSTATLTMGDVTVEAGATWTVQNTGSLQSNLQLTIDSLTIASDGTATFDGTTYGPSVTTNGNIANSGTLFTSSTLLDVMRDFTQSAIFTPYNTHIRFSWSGSPTIPAEVYDQLSLLGSGVYALAASTTVIATTTIAPGATLDLATYRLNAIGNIVNSGNITSSSGAILHHPVDYIRFSDNSGLAVSSLEDGDSLYISVKDLSRNLDGTTQETMMITATSTAAAGSESEVLTLVETAPSSGIFRNVSALSVDGVHMATVSNGPFKLTGNGTAYATYVDAFDETDAGSTSVTVNYTQLVAPAPAPAAASSGGGAVGGGGGGGGVSSIANLVFLSPVSPSVGSSPSVLPPTSGDGLHAIIPPLVQDDEISDRILTIIRSDARVFGVDLSSSDEVQLERFVAHGSSLPTIRLGEGERRALMRDALQTMGQAPTMEDVNRLAEGQIPRTRNLTLERAQLNRVRSTFRAIYGHDPRFQDQAENQAWNTLMYRIRFHRDLSAEREGAVEFHRLFGRVPSDPFQWATVRVLGYVKR